MICIETKHWRRVFSAWADIMRENRDYLIELDGVAGDSDLGLTMTDGFAAARDAVLDFEGDDAGRLLYTGGKAIMRHAPSSLGTLLGSGFLEAGKRLKGREALPLDEAYRLFEAIEENIMARGSAKVGEKTFLDGIDPAVRALRTADWSAGAAEPLRAAAQAARDGAAHTRDLIARHGRMAIRGEASLGMLDPGAVVAALLVTAFADTLAVQLSDNEL